MEAHIATLLPPLSIDNPDRPNSPNKVQSTDELLGSNEAPKISRNNLQALLWVLGLSTPLPRCESVLVGIDFENISNIKDDPVGRDYQVGLAVLDLKHLASSATPPQKLISTYNFVTGSSKYCQKAKRKYLFGETLIVSHANMLANIQNCIPQKQYVYFVGHDIRHDLHALYKLKFKFEGSVFGVFDTMKIAGEVLPYFSLSLLELLLELGCPFDRLHNGGNDANFTLRALLLLAVRHCNNQLIVEERLATFEEIASTPIPVLAKDGRVAKKKEKRYRKSRKYQSKSWSSEKQEEIRAERAARRLEEIGECRGGIT